MRHERCAVWSISEKFHIHVYFPWLSRDGIEPEYWYLLFGVLRVHSFQSPFFAIHFLTACGARRNTFQTYFIASPVQTQPYMLEELLWWQPGPGSRRIEYIFDRWSPPLPEIIVTNCSDDRWACRCIFRNPSTQVTPLIPFNVRQGSCLTICRFDRARFETDPSLHFRSPGLHCIPLRGDEERNNITHSSYLIVAHEAVFRYPILYPAVTPFRSPMAVVLWELVCCLSVESSKDLNCRMLSQYPRIFRLKEIRLLPRSFIARYSQKYKHFVTIIHLIISLSRYLIDVSYGFQC
jgi:hypothetical protein